MRTTLSAFLIILLHCACATAAMVNVEEPLVKLVTSAGQLRAFCSASGEFDACTLFISYRLETSCEQHGSSWQLATRASFRPWIRLQNIRRLAHEQMHIGDVRESVARYAESLEAVTFTSRSQCEAVGFAERSGFEERMFDFAQASNAMRHPNSPVRAFRTDR